MNTQSCMDSPIRQMLSDYGRRVTFLTDGILGQTAQACEKAWAFNATLGEARENGRGIYIRSLHDELREMAPEDIYPYTPPGGLPELRKRWREKMLVENPSLAGTALSLPVTCAGLTHGLSLIAALFLDPGGAVVLHEHHWENYSLIFGVRSGGCIRQYPTFSGHSFNVEGMRRTILSCPQEKVFVVLNFPNNPTGYMPDEAEAEAIGEALAACADVGKKLVVLCDDAYYGFWYSDECMHESLFGKIAGRHPNILAVRLDGVTKEYFAGGLRLGFITFGGQNVQVLEELEKKMMGAVRISVSSCSHFAQSLLLKGLDSPAVQDELAEKKTLLVSRGKKTMELCRRGSTAGLWKAWPFRAGYFVCLQLKYAQADTLRRRLLQQYGIGVISLGEQNIRIALPCLETEQLETLFGMLDSVLEEIGDL